MSERKIEGESSGMEETSLEMKDVGNIRVPFFLSVGEVISVTVSLDDGKKCNPYGKIRVYDDRSFCWGPIILYDRSREVYETRKDSQITLQWPYRPITIDCRFKLEARLFHYNNLCDLETCYDEYHWNPDNHDHTDEYDEVLQFDLEGDHGMATVKYIVYNKAFAAKVELEHVVNHDGKCEVDLESVTANFPCSQIELFNAAASGNSKVTAGELVPLYRSYVLVPYGSLLHISVDGVIKSFGFTSLIDTSEDIFKCGCNEFKATVNWFVY